MHEWTINATENTPHNVTTSNVKRLTSVIAAILIPPFVIIKTI